MFKEYLLEKHASTLWNILLDPETNKHYTLNINFPDLHVADQSLVNLLLTDPEETLKKCHLVVTEVQECLLKNASDEKKLLAVIKPNVHVRVHELSQCPELSRDLFPRNEDIGLFLQVSGTVVRVTLVKMLEHTRVYTCRKCKYKQLVQAEYELSYTIQPPISCCNPESCPGSKFFPITDLDSRNCKDYQEIKIQEHFSQLDVGTMPNTMWVTLENDLVDICKPGDSVTVCGTIKRRWGPLIPGKKIQVECVIKSNHVQINNDTKSNCNITSEIIESFDDFWRKYDNCSLNGRDLILRSFCPQIYGMYLVKLAIAVVLAGGSSFEKNNDTGVRTRTEPHLLLVGDPGTGKSQLLKFATRVISRSVFTTGIGSTSAGLTVAAVMDNGEWHLEGGALVLADGGICCIDEFNSMKSHDKTSIHEAMEQQIINVAKAGFVCKLNTRCSILAAINPVTKTTEHKTSTAVNTGLSSPLLSRFDLILVLQDKDDLELDQQVTDYILKDYKHSTKFIDDKHHSWSLEKLQAYFTVIKKRNPKLTEGAQKILSAYYQFQRQSESRNKARTTVRLLDSLIRLSQAHARLMFHDFVEVMDAIIAVSLVEISPDYSCLQLDFDPFSNFPSSPMESYFELRDCILSTLNLMDLRNEITTNNESTNKNHTKVTTSIDVNLSGLNQLNIKPNGGSKSDDGVELAKITSEDQIPGDKSNDLISADGESLIGNFLNNVNVSPDKEIEPVAKKIKCVPREKKLLVGKLYTVDKSKTDSGNFSQTSFSSIFEEDNFDDINLDI